MACKKCRYDESGRLISVCRECDSERNRKDSSRGKHESNRKNGRRYVHDEEATYPGMYLD